MSSKAEMNKVTETLRRQWKFPPPTTFLTSRRSDLEYVDMDVAEILAERSEDLPQLMITLAYYDQRRMREKLFALVQARPEAAAGALRQLPLFERAEHHRLVKIRLLETLYMTFPDYDPNVAGERLADGDASVRRTALVLLAQRRDFRRCVRDILDGAYWRGKAAPESAKEMAGWILSSRSYNSIHAWGQLRPDLDAACLEVLSEPGLSSILWAFPGGLPRVRRHRWIAKVAPFEADPLFRDSYLVMMLTVPNLEIPPLAQKISPLFLEEDLERAAEDVFQAWAESGPDAPPGGLPLFCGVHMSERLLPDFEGRLNELAGQGRTDLAADSLLALSRGNRFLARPTLARLSREHENEELRQVAGRIWKDMGPLRFERDHKQGEGAVTNHDQNE